MFIPSQISAKKSKDGQILTILLIDKYLEIPYFVRNLMAPHSILLKLSGDS